MTEFIPWLEGPGQILLKLLLTTIVQEAEWMCSPGDGFLISGGINIK